MQETWVQSLGWKDPLEKGKTTHSSILAWKIPWTTVHGVTESDTTGWLSLRSSPVACWTPSDLGDSSSVSYLFGLFYSLWGSHGKCTEVVHHSLLHWITFCQNSLLWPICLRWPCMAWLIASLTYISPFAVTRQWSTRGYLSLTSFNSLSRACSSMADNVVTAYTSECEGAEITNCHFSVATMLPPTFS